MYLFNSFLSYIDYFYGRMQNLILLRIYQYLIMEGVGGRSIIKYSPMPGHDHDFVWTHLGKPQKKIYFLNGSAFLLELLFYFVP